MFVFSSVSPPFCSFLSSSPTVTWLLKLLLFQQICRFTLMDNIRYSDVVLFMKSVSLQLKPTQSSFRTELCLNVWAAGGWWASEEIYATMETAEAEWDRRLHSVVGDRGRNWDQSQVKFVNCDVLLKGTSVLLFKWTQPHLFCVIQCLPALVKKYIMETLM